MDEFDDPEMSYRRGFYQGAWILFEVMERYLPPARALAAREWIQKDVFGWRLKNMQGKSGREPSGEITAQIAPPTTRTLNHIEDNTMRPHQIAGIALAAFSLSVTTLAALAKKRVLTNEAAKELGEDTIAGLANLGPSFDNETIDFARQVLIANVRAVVMAAVEETKPN
jgi:hypothetical protein